MVRTIAVDVELVVGADKSASIDQLKRDLKDILSDESLKSGIKLIDPDSGKSLSTIIGQLGEIVSLTKQISEKSFNITASFGGNRTNTEELRLYKNQATELLGVIEQMNDAIQRIDGNSLGKALGGDFSRFYTLAGSYKGAGAIGGQIDAATTVGSVKKITASLMEMYDIYNRVFDRARSGGADIPLIDTSGFESARAAIANFDSGVENFKQTLVTASQPVQQISADIQTGSTEGGQSFDKLSSSIGETLADIRKQIESTFDLSTVDLHAESLKEQLSEITESVRGARTSSGGTVQTAPAGIDGAAIQNVENIADETLRLDEITRVYKDDEEEAYKTTQKLASENRVLKQSITEVTKAKKDGSVETETTTKVTYDYRQERALRDQQTAANVKYAQSINLVDSALSKYARAQNSAKAGSKEAYAALVANRNAVEEAKKSYGETRDFDGFKNKIAETNAETRKQVEILKQNDEGMKTFGERVTDTVKKFSAWFGTTRLIMAAYRAIKQMVQASIELDSALTQLQIVTKASDATMAQFAGTIAESAKRIGSSITDLTNSATVFARLGYSLNESAKLAEYSTMLQNVANIDSGAASDAITAIVKAYNVDINDIESVMDKLVEVGKYVAQRHSNMSQEIGYIGQRWFGIIHQDRGKIQCLYKMGIKDIYGRKRLLFVA